MALISNPQTRPSIADQIDEFMQRVVDALGSSNLETIESVKAKAETLLKLAKDEAEAKVKSAIDPLATRAELSEAKRQAELASQDVDRLQYASDQLSKKAFEILEAEKKENQLSQYKNAASVRDFVAIQIAEKYPVIAEELVRLLTDIAHANSLCDAANNNLPEGFDPLQRPEGKARGFHDHGSYSKPISGQTFRLTQTILPTLEETTRAAWPPKTKEGEVQRDKIYSAAEVQNRFGQRTMPV